MTTSTEEIIERWERRKKDQHPLLEEMREIRQYYNGDIVVPLPEMDENERPAVANLVMEGIDHTSMRVASTLPDITSPALEPRKREGVRSKEYADIRRRAVAAWWDKSNLQRLQRFRARYMIAYSMAPVSIEPDFELGIPRWRLRNPLNTYPAPMPDGEDITPSDCIFAFSRSFGWLKKNYPEEVSKLRRERDTKWDDMFELIEFVDDEERVLIAIGKAGSQYTMAHEPGMPWVELERIPNLAGICPVVTANRVTLDRLTGQFNQIIGLFQGQARLMALNLAAVEKGVFPDMAIFNRQGGQPTLLEGEWKDGRTGEINVVQDGEVTAINQTPGPLTGEAMDRLERGQRMVGIPAQWQGEQPSNIRTGRAAEITMSAAVDFRIQEYQETAAQCLEEENRRAIAIAKKHFGNREKSFHVGLPKLRGQVDYTANKHFETDETEVRFPMPGADVNNAALAVGQRVGMGLMSRRAGMRVDPLVEEPEKMYDEIQAEELERATLQSILAMAEQGAIPPSDMARIDQLVFEEGKSIYEAILQAQDEAQERQAEQVPEGDPAAEPGLAMEGMGAESTAIPEPNPNMGHLQSLLNRIRQPDSAAGGAAQPMAEGAG